ncbi:MAG TPA: hypothetical protein VHW66_05190 [Stellaceae bacterium]|jgi:hypothetical protein|nr:hypothetical protein [Stellaceae bacterium]
MYRHVCASIGLAAVFALAAVQPGLAEEHHGGGNHGGHEGGHFNGGGGHWNGHVGNWHGGAWNHGWHNGRFGWWWVAPGFADWYFYNAPVYPSPDPYVPPGIAAGPSPYWYYCANPQGYYPYVPQCYGPWQPVPPQQMPPG